MTTEVVYELCMHSGNILAGQSLNALVDAANAEISNPALKLRVSAAHKLAWGKYKKSYHKGAKIVTHAPDNFIMKPGTTWVPHRTAVVPKMLPRRSYNFIVTLGAKTYYGPVLSAIVKYVNQNRPAETREITSHGLKHLEAGRIQSHAGFTELACRRQGLEEPVGCDWLLVNK